MQNLNLIYNKLYYSKLSEINFSELASKDGRERKNAVRDFSENIKEKNFSIQKTVFNPDEDYVAIDERVCSHKFRMKTVYPGLLIGSGNPHGSHLSQYDTNIGFSFDYVTGQPYIPGSSVKGVLRSHFITNPEVVAELLKCIAQKDVDVKKLEQEIFDGEDIFFDAVIYEGNRLGRVVDFDYLAPHPKKTKAPKPIQFIKVLPEVGFEFRFRFGTGNCVIGNHEKLELFRNLVELFGVGAKTNTGYGRMKTI